ncbi:MAG: CPBP family intramembrane metalloprotease [Planctomycetes bacterium]|nr:CPBP family intramembrane metalloprotease [Planctomycetota bacterium]
MLASNNPASQATVALTLIVVQYALVGAGALIALAWLVTLVRRRRWRQPLAEVRCTGQGPSFMHLLLVVAVFLLLQNITLTIAFRGLDRAALQNPSSHVSHTVMTIVGAAKLLACVLITLILARVRSFAPASLTASAPPPLSFLRMSRLAIAGTLIILPIVALQLNMGQILWRWYSPTPLPVHNTFEALRDSEWGTAGVVQLFVMAIVVAPITEELLFRGLLLQLICRYTRRTWVAIALSGALFGLVHLDLPQAVLPLTSMGIILGYVRVKYRSIELCILIHALFNAQAMVTAFLAPELIPT